jgi:DNA (cytosine-5)-methyltransferase 1
MNAVDLFAGAGGWSHGWREATDCEPMVAVNHDPHAVHLHTLNHPATQHFLEDVWSVDPVTAIAGRQVDWLHGSPDCTHFSRAKGAAPKSKSIRGLAWVLVDWARAARPCFLSLENVGEFTTWGPLGDDGQPIKAKAGETFREFVAALRGLGYSVDWRELCAADYGAPTTRRRLFLVARADGRPVAWPEPTHADPSKRDLFSMTLLPWRAVRECIDWSIPVPSIFTRKKPLAAATCRRIAEGVVRFVLNGRPELAVRGNRLVAAFIAQHYGGQVGKSLSSPLPTITTQDHHSLVEVATGGTLEGARKVAAFITSYYSGGGTSSSINRPLPTIVTHDRHGVVTVALENGGRLELGDIGMRMLSPRELARAQGFPDSYQLEGSKRDQTARIGNSVVPQLAAAIVRANLELAEAVA